jgi:hypothetical protein
MPSEALALAKGIVVFEKYNPGQVPAKDYTPENLKKLADELVLMNLRLIDAQAAAVAAQGKQASSATARDQRQARVVDFVKTRFGEANMDRRERAARVLEEALEIAQVEGMTIADVAKLGNHVYSKPAGEPAQEAAGTGVALLAYAAAVGVSADAVEAAEVDRIHSLPAEHFRARHQAKAEAGVAMSAAPSKPVRMYRDGMPD